MADFYIARFNGGCLLLLLFLAGLQTAPVLCAEEENQVSPEPEDDENDGPEVDVVGPDFVTVGVPCSFVCEARCLSSCTYAMSLDRQSATGQGNVLAFTVNQWLEALTLTCTATDDDTGASSTVTRKLQVLAGPANVSVSGPDLMHPGMNHRFSCHAYCRPSCNYSWQIDKGPWIRGQGNVISITSQETNTYKILTCKATHSVSGLYVMATRNLTVSSGPSQVHIRGPDSVEVARKAKFVCSTECTPSCRYQWFVDGQTVKGQEIELMVEHPLKSLTLKCEAENTATGKTVGALKTARIGADAARSMATRPGRTAALLLLLACITSRVTSL